MFWTTAVFDRCKPMSSRSDAARRLSRALTYPIHDTTPMVTSVSRTKAVEFPGFSGQTLSIRLRGGAMPKSKHQVPGRVRSAYEFIKAHRDQYSVQMMCRVLEVAPSGYYDWLLQPVSNRAQEDARLLRLIRASCTASHGIYGAPRVFLDLREAGETCSKHRVARLMRQANLRALHGYRTRRWAVGKPSVLIPNRDRRRGRLHRYLLQSNASSQSSRRTQSRAIRGRSQASPTSSPLNPGNSSAAPRDYCFS
jgi:hypothetical protein